MKLFTLSVAKPLLSLLIVCLFLATPAEGQLFKNWFGSKDKEQQNAQQQNTQQPPQGNTQPRTAQAQQPRTNQQPAIATDQQAATPRKPMVAIENAPAEQREAFGELIGANWIWSPAHTKDQVPAGDVYFRKTVTIGAVLEFAQVHICADNQYELYVNGRPVSKGNDWRKMEVHDVSKVLKPGRNVIAVKVTNTDEGPAGLVARVLTKEQGGTFESASTDKSWRTSVQQYRNWGSTSFRDDDWLPAAELGMLGATLPWGDEVVIAAEGARFVVDPEFNIQRLTTDDQTGSLIAMTFDGDGNIIASQEGGPLLMVRDADSDGSYESVQTFSEQINTAQGILSLGSNIYAVGNGPDGGALYRLPDSNRDGQAENAQTLVRFRGSPGEHGPHAVRLGPEGLLYVLVGNFARVNAQPSSQSPYALHYEGDLVKPRYEDPRGHAVGVPEPGGTILRTDTRGSFVETMAGGFRNPYDFAFNQDGELFTFDADMEWDLGTPWYRPTRINHVPPGAEMGWRSGWAKWPAYYLDSLPDILPLGGGSPTGVEFYAHNQFPERLQDTLFVGDWGRGLIHAVKLTPEGGSYKAVSSVFLKGRPLNITDMAVGPDGALYFCTGGRGTDGGIYRVSWKGAKPAAQANGIQQALQQPQPDSAWARTQLLATKRQLGNQWDTQLNATLTDPKGNATERTRAFDLLTLFGPPPSDQTLATLTQDPAPAVRARAARAIGLRNTAGFGPILSKLLTDPEPAVRRVACEAIAHRVDQVPVEGLVALLGDGDRFVAFAARRALEKMPTQEWHQQVLNASDSRTFLQGSVSLLAARPSREVALAVAQRCEAILGGQVQDPGQRAGQLSEGNFLDLLRVTQLALLHGKLTPSDVPGLSNQVLARFPSNKEAMNRELVKLLAYLAPPEAATAFANQLASNIPELEKIQLAAYAPRLNRGWQTNEKLAFLRYYESARELVEGGYSVSAYVENFARDFFTNLSLAERRQVLAAGDRFPTSALSVLAKLPPETGADVLAEVCALDRRLEPLEGDVFDRLRVGIVATLGRFNDPASLTYLHELYRNQPERRAPIAMSLTQNPTGENWELLVDSLKAIDGVAAGDVLQTLTQVGRRPETAEPYRHAILLGLKLGENDGKLASQLLSVWTGRQTQGSHDQQMVDWQTWYAQSFPDSPPAELPRLSQPNKWSYEELLSFLDSEEGQAGDAHQGKALFTSAKCIDCHRMQGQGERMGPDLTAVAGRFQRKEILESIVYPSHDISDQYASHSVLANGRTYVGIAIRDGADGVVVLTSTGEKVRLAQQDVEEVRPSSQSAMPEGLLNTLSLEEVAHLFAYLTDKSHTNMASREAAEPR